MPLIPVLERQRQADPCKFESSLVYRESPRVAKARQWDPFLIKQTNKQIKLKKKKERKSDSCKMTKRPPTLPSLGEASVHFWINLELSPTFSICHCKSMTGSQVSMLKSFFLLERSDRAKCASLRQGEKLHVATPSLVPVQKEPLGCGRCRCLSRQLLWKPSFLLLEGLCIGYVFPCILLTSLLVVWGPVPLQRGSSYWS